MRSIKKGWIEEGWGGVYCIAEGEFWEYSRFWPQDGCVDETRCGNLLEFRLGFLFAASHSAEFNNALMHAK